MTLAALGGLLGGGFDVETNIEDVHCCNNACNCCHDTSTKVIVIREERFVRTEVRDPYPSLCCIPLCCFTGRPTRSQREEDEKTARVVHSRMSQYIGDKEANRIFAKYRYSLQGERPLDEELCKQLMEAAQKKAERRARRGKSIFKGVQALHGMHRIGRERDIAAGSSYDLSDVGKKKSNLLMLEDDGIENPFSEEEIFSIVETWPIKPRLNKEVIESSIFKAVGYFVHDQTKKVVVSEVELLSMILKNITRDGRYEWPKTRVERDLSDDQIVSRHRAASRAMALEDRSPSESLPVVPENPGFWDYVNVGGWLWEKPSSSRNQWSDSEND